MNELRREDEFTLKVSRVGNSLGVILPKELISQLGLKEGDRLEATRLPERGLSLTPFDKGHADAMKIARELMHEYRDTLRALAK
jgi:putative addiction module antidote